MADQAKAFDCTPSYISQIETGQRSAPEDYVKRFTEWLHLTDDVEKYLEELASAKRKVIRIEPNDEKRASLIVHLHGALKTLPDEKLNAIRAIIDSPCDVHSQKQITETARLAQELLGTRDLLRRVESFLAQLDPEAHIRVLPRGTKVGATRSYSNTLKSQKPHVAFTEDLYLAASEDRSDARRSLIEELAHFIFHRGRKMRDGGNHSRAHYAMEREANLFVLEFFLPKERALAMETADRAQRLMCIPMWTAKDGMARHGLWPNSALSAQAQAAA